MEGNVVLFDSVSMALPAQTGTDNEIALSIFSISVTVDGAKCTPSSNPIPAVSGHPDASDIGATHRP
jgi:hypothetical protein